MTTAPTAGPFPRLAADALRSALGDTPVVLLHGPRQSGKTSLAQSICQPMGYGYLTFDDDNLAAAARADPVGFVADLPARMVLDEVQRVPQIFTSLKAAVDRDRVPGRFLLTGSSNVLLLPNLADSLAGRMEAVRLHPLAQCEIERGRGGFLELLLSGHFAGSRHERLGPDLARRVMAGGYPAALQRTGQRRGDWYRAYVQSLLQRDVRDLARIAALEVLPRLMELAAARTAQLWNINELAGPFQLSTPTIRQYMLLLQRLFLVEALPPWNLRRLERLVKTPKLHIGDTGLACALLRIDDRSLPADGKLLGAMLETFVYQELRRQADAGHFGDLAFHHFRDRDGHEVDIVIEQGAHAVVGVEVKGGSTVRESDFRGLRKLRDLAGPSFLRGIVLYDGESILRFGQELLAVPISALLRNHMFA
ncbi:MAG TPA: ATP-binding protein [Ramlibacter sp.]|uniref:ATP-binding protein n=1 Tax=Ramlibacter sp. TaxID=1917967 RepID=UPI002C26F280|nr:ATP-binding protein [Ramlibacter sp.]HVZ44779.1 ATP-binding protein [Ramlibacter sp.]